MSEGGDIPGALDGIKVKVPGFPVKFSGTPCAIQREAPELGQHTEEVPLEQGYSWEDIAQMREQNAI